MYFILSYDRVVRMKKIFMQILSMSDDGQYLVIFIFILPFLVVFYFTGNNFVLFYLIAQKLYKEKSYIKFYIMITFMIVYTLLGFLLFGYGSWTFF